MGICCSKDDAVVDRVTEGALRARVQELEEQLAALQIRSSVHVDMPAAEDDFRSTFDASAGAFRTPSKSGTLAADFTPHEMARPDVPDEGNPLYGGAPPILPVAGLPPIMDSSAELGSPPTPGHQQHRVLLEQPFLHHIVTVGPPAPIKTRQLQLAQALLPRPISCGMIPAAAAPADPTVKVIRVCSWNICRLGTGERRVNAKIAALLHEYDPDIVFIQELVSPFTDHVDHEGNSSSPAPAAAAFAAAVVRSPDGKLRYLGDTSTAKTGGLHNYQHQRPKSGGEANLSRGLDYYGVLYNPLVVNNNEGRGRGFIDADIYTLPSPAISPANANKAAMLESSRGLGDVPLRPAPTHGRQHSVMHHRHTSVSLDAVGVPLTYPGPRVPFLFPFRLNDGARSLTLFFISVHLDDADATMRELELQFIFQFIRQSPHPHNFIVLGDMNIHMAVEYKTFLSLCERNNFRVLGDLNGTPVHFTNARGEEPYDQVLMHECLRQRLGCTGLESIDILARFAEEWNSEQGKQDVRSFSALVSDHRPLFFDLHCTKLSDSTHDEALHIRSPHSVKVESRSGAEFRGGTSAAISSSSSSTPVAPPSALAPFTPVAALHTTLPIVHTPVTVIPALAPIAPQATLPVHPATPTPANPTRTQVSNMNKAALQAQLRARGVSDSGNLPELKNRLRHLLGYPQTPVTM